ncbi:AMP-binding protein [Mesobacterium pallidum]|uniref:AMP-binding protein n=1 Tax=Mesobacterium pallidum TaxID=2872037 RepID=UPI001EE2B57C|nr:AMP-binding protein [Mesobacterium pallidum]
MTASDALPRIDFDHGPEGRDTLDLAAEAGRIRAIADHLGGRIAAGEAVVLVGPVGRDLVLAWYAVGLAGGCPLVLPHRDEMIRPGPFGRLLSRALQGSGATLVVGPEDIAAELPDAVSLVSHAELAALQPVDGATFALSLPDLWATTLPSRGRPPEAVRIAAPDLALRLEALIAGLGLQGAAETICVARPLFDLAGMVYGLALPLLAGARVVLVTPGRAETTAETLAQALARHAVTTAVLPGRAFAALSPEEGVPGLPPVRRWIYANDRGPVPPLANFCARRAIDPASVALSFELAECGGPVTLAPALVVQEGEEGAALSFGPALPGCALSVSDEGEVVVAVGGAAPVSSGYLGRLEGAEVLVTGRKAAQADQFESVNGRPQGAGGQRRPNRPQREGRELEEADAGAMARGARPDRPQRGPRPDGMPPRDRPQRGPQSERPDRPARPLRADRPEGPPQGARPDRPDRPDRPQRPNRAEGAEAPVRPQREGRPERPARGDRPERPERPGRGDRSERPERPERPGRGERPDRPGRGDRPGRLGRGERPERPARGERPEGWGRAGTRPQLDPWPKREDIPDIARRATEGDIGAMSRETAITFVTECLTRALDETDDPHDTAVAAVRFAVYRRRYPVALGLIDTLPEAIAQQHTVMSLKSMALAMGDPDVYAAHLAEMRARFGRVREGEPGGRAERALGPDDLRGFFADGEIPDGPLIDVLKAIDFEEAGKSHSDQRIRRLFALRDPGEDPEDFERRTQWGAAVTRFVTALRRMRNVNGDREWRKIGRLVEENWELLEAPDFSPIRAAVDAGQPIVIVSAHTSTNVAMPTDSYVKLGLPVVRVTNYGNTNPNSSLLESYVVQGDEGPAQFLKLAKRIRKEQIVVVIFPDGAKSDEPTFLNVAGREIPIGPGAETLAWSGKARVFWVSTYWSGSGFRTGVIEGPDAATAESREAFAEAYQSFYADRLTEIVTGPPEDIGTGGGFIPLIARPSDEEKAQRQERRR